MRSSFLEYSYSVIYSRALPDARDGLKPVHRRILYMMADMGLRPERGHVKSARVVGEVMGKLHPHGDSAIYDSLVRMAQAFSLRNPLIDGHGNFGSLDDGPAAARYTEARLASIALAMTDGLDEDVVDFIPNYDNSHQQPEVLPSAIPNLLVNGSSGIAVGMATNMAPHNLVEVVQAARHLIDHPDATLEDLMGFVPGPDFPSGGTIVGLAGVRDAYSTGRGSFRVRAKVNIEQLTARKTGLVVTELPYGVGPEKVIEKIKDGIKNNKITGVSDFTDLTDRKRGMRLVIGVKTGFNPQAVLDQLYKLTPLEDGFSINNVALVDGQPQTLGLKALLSVYLEHRIEVVTRRTEFRLARRNERLHLVEGLLKAIVDIDKVIAIIRTSDDVDQARTSLIEQFALSLIQSEYILELRLRRLTKFSMTELETEKADLLAQIAYLKGLLANKQALRDLVSTELGEAAKLYGDDRRTQLSEAVPVSAAIAKKGATASLELADVPTRVFLTASGLLARVDLADDATISVPTGRSSHDTVASALNTTSRADIGAVTNRGRLIRFTPADLPALPADAIQLAAGVKAVDYVNVTDKNERVIAVVSLTSVDPITLGTALGVVKRVATDSYPKANEFPIIGLKAGDELVGAVHASDDAEIVFVTSDAQLLHFPAAGVRPQGCPAGGVAGMKLAADAKVIAFNAVAKADADAAVVVTITGTDTQAVKTTAFAEYPGKGRGGGGVRAMRFLKGQDGVSAAWVGTGPAYANTKTGAAAPLPATHGKRDGSGDPITKTVAALGARIS
ncbi:DNA gyrase/topoisomerase IV subunit A [Leifsonia sp. Leaf264]|uniref:DNA gyrase/topoisomerase IV subunit A n=1 Tax=Leifsonia sp. Leaf264 TaxID=1736314 RepID=UPI0009EB9998|nr:DNA topoisomerase IV subunit A [Leifsonia sp. Leaf264]